jgi:hypothetical protein
MVNPIPLYPNKDNFGNDRSISSSIKIASSNLFILDEPVVSADTMTDMIFQDIGGHELTQFLRNDMIDGEITSIQPFANFSSIAINHNPNNIIKIQGSDEEIFNSNPIQLETYIPKVGTGQNGQIVYVDTVSGSSTINNIIINTIGTLSNQYVEVEFLSFDTPKDGTIYL